MRGVAVIASKGGVGKSTLCHLLALGCAWRDVPAYMFHTDDREPMTVVKRQYAFIDARDLKRLKTVADSLINSNGFCVFDGGGNRPEFDEWISKFVDLVLIPVMADEDAVKQAKKTMARLEAIGITHARYLLNMTSSNRNSRLYDFENFFSQLDSKKIAGEVKRVEAVKRLTKSDPKEGFKTPPTNVNNLSRSLHGIVDKALEAMEEPEPETAISA